MAAFFHGDKMRFFPRLLVVLLCCLPVMGQNIRFDQIASTTNGKGQAVPLLALPGVVINFYTGCTVLPCGTKATTYNAPTGSVACPSSQQVIWQIPLPQACTSTADSQGNFGGYFQPGTYQYTVSVGSVTSGPYQFNVGGGGGGGSGVTSINTVGGAFIFNGSGVSCTSTTCSFSGGSGGGVNPGTALHVPYYVDSTHVGSDLALSVSAPTDVTSDLLTFLGGGGINFTTNGYGGLISLVALNTAQNNTPAQINLATSLSTPNSSANPGQIKISTVDTDNVGGFGLTNAANIVIQALENATPATTSNSGNVTISATDNSFGTGGNISLLASGGTNATGGNVSITGSGPGGGNVTINADPTGGRVTITGEDFEATTPNFTVDQVGDVVANGSIRAASMLGSATLAALSNVCTDASSNLVTSGCTGGGGGSGITGLTPGFLPLAGSATTLTANSHLDEVTNAGFDTFSQAVIIGDSSGLGGGADGTEGTAHPAGTGIDTLYADSATHRWKQNPNNTGAMIVNGIASAGTAGDSVALAANGIDLVDTGNHSGAGFTPTKTGDSGAGTGGSLVIAFLAGANDDNGYINLTTGNAPAANAGVITINFGGTYAAARKCSVSPASALAVALGVNGVFVPNSTATNTNFVITIGGTALPANTTGYQFFYRCGN